MSKNVEGAKFVSKGIEYVLNYGPKGNLRPYTIGPKIIKKSKNPYVIVSIVAIVTVTSIGVWSWKKYKSRGN
jgi:hypothetical protein